MIDIIQNHEYEMIAVVRSDFLTNENESIGLMFNTPAEIGKSEDDFMQPALRNMAQPFFVIRMSELIYEHPAFNAMRLIQAGHEIATAAVQQFSFIYRLMRFDYENSGDVLLQYAQAHLFEDLSMDDVLDMHDQGDIELYSDNELPLVRVTDDARKRFIHRFGRPDFESIDGEIAE